VPFRVLQVGLGPASHRWLQNANDHDDVQIVGVVDVNGSHAREVVQAYGFDWPIFTRLEDALEQAEPTLIFDTAPSDLHAEVTRTALGAGCDVFGEKPMVTDEDDALTIIDLAERTGRTFSVMQNRRHHPGVHALRAAVDAGRLGDVGMLAADYFRPGPDTGFRAELPHQLILDMGVHAFDTARALVGADPVRVSSVEFNPPGSWTRGDAALSCLVEFDSGAALSYRGSWASVGCMTTDQQSWRLAGTHGSALWDGEAAPQLETIRPNAASRYECDGDVLHLPAAEQLPPPTWGPGIPDLRLGTHHREGLAEMLAALRAGRPSATDCRANFPTVAAVFAAMRSARSRQFVDVARLPAAAAATTATTTPIGSNS
jgi:predicted dehydrogenase